MAMQNPYNQYKESSIKTATPQELTLMLYNGAIKFINQGKKYCIEKNVSGANESIIRAQDIIVELNSTLNMEYEISNNLRALYNFIKSLLVEANISKDPQHLDNALELVTELRDTWKEAMKLSKMGNR